MTMRITTVTILALLAVFAADRPASARGFGGGGSRGGGSRAFEAAKSAVIAVVTKDMAVIAAEWTSSSYPGRARSARRTRLTRPEMPMASG